MAAIENRELKQTRPRRQRERHLKMWPRLSAIISQLFKAIVLAKCVLTFLELNWNQRLRDKQTKLNICHHMLTLSTTAKEVISRRRKNENVCEMSKDEICSAKRAKILFFIVKYANLYRSCRRRRLGCLSSLICKPHTRSSASKLREVSPEITFDFSLVFASYRYIRRTYAFARPDRRFATLRSLKNRALVACISSSSLKIKP